MLSLGRVLSVEDEREMLLLQGGGLSSGSRMG